MRIAFLQSGLMGYQNACLRALAALGNELLVIYPSDMPNAPFDSTEFGGFADMRPWHGEPPSAAELVETIDRFDPDAVMMTAWRRREYRAVMRAMRGRALRIMFGSNTWHSSLQQWFGRAIHRVYVGPLFDVAFVPGDRSEFFVQRLGFAPENVIRGANSADVALFDRGPRAGDELSGRGRFLFSGRLVDHKAIEVLADAYQAYRSMVDDPWDLTVVGDGPRRELLEGYPGVDLRGFLQPKELADLMHESSCLVLPSYVDFWGVVVHEAGRAGLPLICADQVGAVPYLLQDGYNGWVVGSGSSASLRDALARMHDAGTERLSEMSRASHNLSQRLSPELWARNFHEEVERRLPALRARPPGRLGPRSVYPLRMRPR